VRQTMPIILLCAFTLTVGCAGGGAASREPAGPPWAAALGNWSGPAWVEGEDMQVGTVVSLREESGTLTGTFGVPEMGVTGTPFRDLIWDEGDLTGWINFSSPDGMYLRISFVLRLDGDSLAGSFDSDMVGGIITLTRRK
jgi:hypothetical protein